MHLINGQKGKPIKIVWIKFNFDLIMNGLNPI